MTNQDLESCKRDIEIIKSTIEKSKVNLGSISALFILYGIIMLLKTIATGTIAYAIYITYDWYPVYQTTVNILYGLVFGLFILFYAGNYVKLRKCNNFYTLQLYLLWGFVMFFVPLMNTCFLAVIKTIFGNELFETGIQLIICTIPGILEVFSFVFALMATGLILNKKSITTIAACLFLALLMLYFFFPSDIAAFENYETFIENFKTLTIYNYIGKCTRIGNTIIFLGYIFVGILLRSIKRRYHGTQ